MIFLAFNFVRCSIQALILMRRYHSPRVLWIVNELSRGRPLKGYYADESGNTARVCLVFIQFGEQGAKPCANEDS